MAGETVPCGDGMTEGVRRALSACIDAIIPTMFRAQQPWAVMGSTASVLQGLCNYTPPDIDLVTTRDGAYIMSGSIGGLGATIHQVGYSESDRYASHFGIFEVLDVKVEVMGDLIIRVADGHIDATEHFARWSDKVRLIHFETHHIPVVPLEWQLVANVLLSRPERSTGIADYLLAHGFDRAYLDALLVDKSHGERTIATVREIMHLDD
jgi:hypothetical protein